MEYQINPLATVIADHHLSLRIQADTEVHIEPIITETQMDGLFHLAALSQAELNSAVQELSLQGGELLSSLSGLLLKEQLSILPDFLSQAFMIANWRMIKHHSDHSEVRRRDEIFIIDEALPEVTRSSIELWAKMLPYRRRDIDKPDASYLHWIYTMLPAVSYVRSVPFLRALDDKVREIITGVALNIFRAYVYSGSSADIYRSHQDSKLSSDLTAIYYPAAWEDHYGGELLFYDHGEPRWAVAPRPNRLIVFHGSREHRVAPISHSSDYSRISIVLRYSAA
ncbi:UNVERIFIED_ORG: hypothetical protein J2W66_002663 [Agrobacterium larrymoorei]|nr:hypothetical protein [Agrobacterium larrymoorei]